MKKILLILLTLSLVACAATPYQLRQAKRDFKQQNYRAAYVRLKHFAHKGHPDAQYALGYLYYYGLGTGENPESAKRWFQAAAKSGQQDAQVALSELG